MSQKYNISWIIYLKNNIYLKNTSGYIIILYLCNTNLNDMTYSFGDTEYGRLKMVTLIKSFFALLPPKTKKIRILKKNEKMAGDIIILHICTKNHNQKWNNPEYQNFWKIKKAPWHIILLRMCSINEDMFSDIRCNRQNFLSFWAVFCPFTPLTTRKIRTLKK